MRPIAVGIWPFDDPKPPPLSVPTCWNDALNQQLIAQCENGGPMCTPQSVAHLLSLDYCPGECGSEKKSGVSSSTTMIVGVAAVAVVAALVWQNKTK